MDLTQVIIGQVVTEKAEALKATSRTYILQIAPKATKVDVKNALRAYYDVEATSVRIMRTAPKTRRFGRGAQMEKRHRTKRALITLAPDSKPLDLATFKAS